MTALFAREERVLRWFCGERERRFAGGEVDVAGGFVQDSLDSQRRGGGVTERERLHHMLASPLISCFV